MPRTRPKKTCAALASLATAGVLTMTLGLHDSANADSSVDAASTAMPTTESATATSIQLAAPDADLLRGLDQFSASPVATTVDAVARLQPEISMTKAAEIASSEVGISRLGKPAKAMLGRVTLGQYGTELEPDPTLPSRIEPIVKDAQAWMIVYPSAEVPVFGPHDSREPASVRQPVVAFVDTTTADFLGALSY